VLAQNGAAVNGLDVAFRVDGGPLHSATPCGSGCYGALTTASRPRAVSVRVRSTTVTFRLPERWPAPRADALVRRAARAFRSLRTLTFEERLASGPRYAIQTRFEIVAPDRLRYRIERGASAVVIGARRWDRSPGGKWTLSPQAPLRLPQPPWSDDFTNAHLLGSGRVDGRPVWRVSLRDPTTPAWFQLAIDKRTFRTLELRMTAAAHFMHERYSGFDAPLQIRPPR
jgi:hypothetical protein